MSESNEQTKITGYTEFEIVFIEDNWYIEERTFTKSIISEFYQPRFPIPDYQQMGLTVRYGPIPYEKLYQVRSELIDARKQLWDGLKSLL